MLTNRCSFNLCRILKNHEFPQYSIHFDSSYYTPEGRLVYNLNKIDNNLIFAPYICEVIDRIECDLDLNLNVYFIKDYKYQYRIYDMAEDVEIISDLHGIEKSQDAYELCIIRALEYNANKEKHTRSF